MRRFPVDHTLLTFVVDNRERQKAITVDPASLEFGFKGSNRSPKVLPPMQILSTGKEDSTYFADLPKNALFSPAHSFPTDWPFFRLTQTSPTPFTSRCSSMENPLHWKAITYSTEEEAELFLTAKAAQNQTP